MKGWIIFRHAVNMVMRNLPQAVRISLVPMLIGLVLGAALVAVSGLPEDIFDAASGLEQGLNPDNAGGLVMTLVLLGLLLLTVQLWIFVAWHRFILLEEYPTGWVPGFRGDRILAYAGRGLLLGLIAFAVVFAAGILSAVTGQLAPVIMVLATVFLVFLVFRLATILPAAAIGRPLTLVQAWEATRGSAGAILGLLVVTVMVQVLLQVISGLSLVVFAPLGILFQIFATWAMSLVNVSILTTLFGHYVEGRSLD